MVRASRLTDVPVETAPRNHSGRNYGGRGIAGLLAPVLRPAFKKRAPAAAALLADWDALAGVELAARAAPVKFAGRTLTLACTGPMAVELQHAAPQIIARLNLACGQAMIERLRFVQRAPGIMPPVAAGVAHCAPPPPVDLPEGELGEALAKLYRGIHARGEFG